MFYLKSALVLALSLCLNFNFALAQKTKTKSRDLSKVMEQHVLGLFNNRLQVQASKEMEAIHGPQELRFVRIFPERKDKFYAYVSWASPALPDQPLIHRLVSFDWQETEQGFKGTSYYLPAEEKYGSAWRKPAETFVWEEFETFQVETCSVYLRENRDKTWLWITGEDCSSDNPAAPFKYFQALMTFKNKGIACETIFFEDLKKEMFRHNVFYDLQSRKRLDLPFEPGNSN